MKKLLLLVIAFLPVLGFAQVDLASWNLTTNANVSASQTYVTATAVSFTGSNPSYTSGNLDVAYFNDNSLSHYRFFQITIKPTTGNSLNLSRLKFEQQRLNSGSTYGPSHYGIKYYISNNGSIPDDYNFFVNNSTWLVTEETIAGNPVKDINLSSITLTATQTLVLRFYARGGDYNLPGWRIKANTLKITGTNPNAAPPKPIAVDDTANIPHNTATAINVLQNDTYNNLATTINFTQNPANGTLSINGSNQVVFTPTNGFTGSDTFKYTLTNANGTSTTAATVTVNVAPRANNDTATANQNVATAISVLSNDVTSGATTVNITQNPANGTATVNGSGQIVYTSTGSFTGANTIKYTITSVHGTSTEATVTVNVVPPVPVAVNDTASTLQNQAVTINVLNNDTINGLATTINLTQGSGGTASLNSNQVVFTPTTGFLGNAVFTYTLTNANGTSTSATVTINVTAPIAPTAVADSYPVNMTVYTDLNVLSNDNLGSATSVTAINTTTPGHGTVTVNANNTLRYTPTAGYAGSDSFTYRFSTVYGTTSYVTVSLVVQPQTPTSGALCGDYYVGTGGHFTTITQAVNYVNTNGINCDVKFLLTNANYNNTTGETFPISINAYTGSNTYSLTIKPNTGVSTTVRADNVASTTPVRSVFKLNGARRVVFEGSNNNTATKNFTIVNNCTVYDGSSRTVFALTGTHSNITFNNLQITQANENGPYAYASGIFAGGDDMANGQASSNASSNLIVSNNDFSGVKQGIYVHNNDGTTLTTVSVFGNRFGQNVGSIKAQNAIHLGGVANFSVYQNQIKDINSSFNATDYRGIYVNGNDGSIYKNTIYSIKRNGADQSISGIWLKSNVGSNPVNVTVSNNFITDVQSPGVNGGWSQGAYGLYIESGTGFKIYHNSINLKQQSQNQGISAAFFVVNGVNLDVRNNIFNNNLEYNGPARAAIAIVNLNANGTTTFAHLDYNNYFSKGIVGIMSNINYLNASNPGYISTLPSWKTALGKDAHSTSVQPAFVNENSDLHLVATATVNVQYLTGVSVSQTGITQDIDGDLRYIPSPTMGADEIPETCAPTGDQTAFGVDSWIGYVYDNAVGFDINNQFQSSKYRGYILEPNGQTFEHDYGQGAISGAYLCGTYYNTFAIRHKMRKNFPAGYYTFTVSGDDGYRLSINGTEVLADWNDHGPTTRTASLYLNGSTDLILEYYENGGGAIVSFNYTMCAPTATAPTSITGNLTVCAGSPTTLTAVGATGTGATYEWGTGSVVGTNPIANQNGVSITVTPTQQTTYWVRTIDGACQSPTSGVTVVVTMGTVAGNPTVFGNNAWNVYAFNETNMTPSLSNYKGFYTQNTVSVNTTTAWGINASPATATTTPTNTAYQGCPVGNDNFTFIQKRKGFPAGSYELRMLTWDDATMVFVDGVEVVNYGGWYNGTELNNLVGVFCLGPNSTIEIRTIENGGEAQVKMNLVPTNVVYNNTGWTSTPNERGVEIQNSINVEASLKVCTCTVKAGTILTVKANQTLTVIEDIVVENGGKIIVEDNGALVQIDDNATYTGETTSFAMYRKAEPMYRYDFTYWSSPVEGFKLKAVSPLTLFDKFYSWNINNQAWTTLPQPANATTLMETGVGYIVRAPQSYNTNPTIRAIWESEFVGKPNNGVKQVAVANGAANKWTLIGNPYASAIDADVFLNANPNIFEDGAIYFWTHNAQIVPTNTGSQIYTYSASDYATWNKSGATRAGSGGELPVGKIASGQSFFIKGKETNPAGTQAIFNNSMRIQAGNQNGQFFRPSPSQPVDNWENTGKHRVWLNLTGGTNAFNQTMVGYIENATNDLDFGYDATVFSGGEVSLYSLINDKKLTIQGRALPFNNQDEVPLGYKTTLTGTLKVSIDAVDGLFEGQNVYLEDKELNIVHDLKNADYTFTTVPGTFNERFVLRYVPAAELGIDNPTVEANSIMVFRNGSQIDIKSKDQSIEHVTVYDLLGKVIFDKNKINAQSFSTTQLNASNQVVIVKVITDTQAEVVKKVIMN